MKRSKTRNNLTKLAVTAMLTAVAVVLQYLEFGVPFVPSFLKMDFSDIPELIAAFAVGPIGGVTVALLKNLIHMAVSQSGFVGELSNFILGAAFSLTAGLIYKAKHTRAGAIAACFAACAVMALVSLPSNYYLIYPIYAKLFGGMEPILGAYQAIIPAADTLWKALLIVNVPFTLVKGLICAAVTIPVYKPLSRALERMKLKTK